MHSLADGDGRNRDAARKCRHGFKALRPSVWRLEGRGLGDHLYIPVPPATPGTRSPPPTGEGKTLSVEWGHRRYHARFCCTPTASNRCSVSDRTVLYRLDRHSKRISHRDGLFLCRELPPRRSEHGVAVRSIGWANSSFPDCEGKVLSPT